ncbi:VOC family protein [Candidatus Parcubacteria bacterium]|nr:VOC family protein [Candidatus Parcubacteria bacterium]
MNPVVHFEMPYEDKDRAAKFYKAAFGWKAQMMGPDMGEYVVMQTTETDEKGMNQTPGTINGGMYKKPKDEMGRYPSFVIAVTDINEAIKKIKAAQGTVIGGSKRDGNPEEIPGVGLFASFIDSEGNRLSIMQPNPRM